MNFITSGRSVFSVTYIQAVTGLTASNPTASTANLAWIGARSAISYSIVSTPATTTQTTSSTSYTFTGLSASTSYTFTVTSVGPGGPCDSTTSSSVTTSPPPVSTGTALWAARIAGTNEDYGYGDAVDSSGNVYVVGQYQSSPLTIYNADGNSSGITLTNDGGDVYVVKYNTSGTALWATHIGGTNNEGIQCAISVDSAGNAYVTSASYDALTIYNAGGNPSGITLPGSGNIGTFIVKYNTSGTALWATQIGGSGFDSARSITIDSSSNVYVTGFYSANPLIIYNADGNPSGITATKTGSSDAYIVKYNTSGYAQWAAHFGGSGNIARGFGIIVDSSSNVYVTGSSYAATVTFYNANGSPSGITVTNGSTAGVAIVVKYNTSGTVLWASRIDGLGDQRAMTTSVDGAGNVYVAGLYYFSDPLTIYNANGSAFGTTLTHIGSDDVFVVKYNTSGTTQWVTKIAGTGGDIAVGISVDSAGNSYVTGYYGSNPVTIYNADTSTFGILFGSGSDVFVVKYDTSGTAQWATRIAGNGNDVSGGVSVGGSINSYITGTYTANPLSIYNADTTEFGTLTNSGGNDVFIVKYA